MYMAKWPHVLPSAIGSTINAKLTELRGERKAEMTPERALQNDSLLVGDKHVCFKL